MNKLFLLVLLVLTLMCSSLVVAENVTNNTTIDDGIMVLDLEDTFTIVMLVFCFVVGFLVSAFFDTLYGGAFIGLLGFVLLVSGFSVFMSALVIFIGFGILFVDEPLISQNKPF